MAKQKFDFQRIDLPGRDVWRCRNTGRVLNDGKPFGPQEFKALGTVVEPTRDPRPELPAELSERIEKAERMLAEALAAVERANEAYWPARDERNRAHREWGNSAAGFREPAPRRLRKLDDAADRAWAKLAEARELEGKARVELTHAKQAAGRWRRAAEARARQAAAPPPTLGERIEALGGQAAS